MRRLRRAAVKHVLASGGSLAEQAYTEFGDSLLWVEDGKEMPSWEELPEKRKNAWTKVVSKITEMLL